VGIRKSINNCVATLENPLVNYFSPYEEIKKNGKNITVPMFKDEDQTTSTFYRVRSDKISPHSSVEILLAVVGGTPTWTAVSSKYSAIGRDRMPFNPQCFLRSCNDVPKISDNTMQ
jgi:hypothetical protein